MTAPLDFSRPHVLRGDTEYDAAIDRIDHLLCMDPEPRSDKWEELRFLSVLVEAYEEEHYPIEPATPDQIVDFLLDQRGMERKDLNDIMGGPSRVSEFFSGKRALSLNQIKALRKVLGVSADALIPRV